MDDPISRLEAIFEAADALLAAGVIYNWVGSAKVRAAQLDKLRYAVSRHKQALSPQEAQDAP